MKISIVICYTKQDVLNECINSIKTQTLEKDIELILIDNTNNAYSSAASALNYGAKQATGELLLFAHQDIIFENESDLAQIVEFFSKHTELCLVGVAGINNKKQVCSNITETTEHIIRYPVVIDKPTEVETVDECFLAIRKVYFDSILFDEVACANWHFYGVDLSLQVRQRGGKVFCVPIPICHLSKGTLSSGFFKSLKMLGKKYRNDIKEINSTCVQIKNTGLSIFWRHMMFEIKNKVKRLLKK